ncbi:MAG: hypothetical protein KatS3mg110_3283 [Pirellulaceae bacterium]|nr:MAG: hypothetical protein KatS3mg110_3283 [Pirellulaceae bacterium]
MARMTRRRMCGALFLGAIVSVTLLHGWWALHTTQARRMEAWQQRLRRWCIDHLQMAAAAQRMELCRDGVQFEQLALYQAGRKQPAAHVHRLRLARDAENQWTIEVDYPQLTSDMLAHGAVALCRQMEQGQIPWQGNVHIRVKHATLNGGSRKFSFVHAACRFDANKTSPSLSIWCTPDGAPDDHTLEIQLTRDQNADFGLLKCTIDTRGRWFPVWLASAWLPHIAMMGNDCEFQGVIRSTIVSGGWQIESLTGSFRNVDLHRLVTEQFPHHMISGSAELRVENMRCVDGRLCECRGRLVVEKGVVSSSLLEAASRFLHWELDKSQNLEDRVEFRAMDVSFTLQGSNLIISGNGKDSVILWRGDAPLARDDGSVVPVVNLIRVLVPQSVHQVPATRQTAALASILPVPDLVAEQSPNRPAPPAIRLGKLPDGVVP